MKAFKLIFSLCPGLGREGLGREGNWDGKGVFFGFLTRATKLVISNSLAMTLKIQ